MSVRFEVGKTYAQRFMSDYDTIARFTILARTVKTIRTKAHGRTVTRRLSVVDGVEQFKPFGTYSMCMVVDANDIDTAV